MTRKILWVNISLIHLCIVAFLGMLLRSKILFPIPGIDFKYLLNAHSHFAFGGWVTLILMVLMIYNLLPEPLYKKRIYQWILAGIAFNAWGMLLSFPFEGYAFFSILFSTLFIIVTYVFCWVFIADIRQSHVSTPVALLSVSSLVCLALSSVGPYTLAYLLATKSGDFLLYKDAVYTYLHLQYNGFFTLAVFSLLLHKLYKSVPAKGQKQLYRFSVTLCLSILPSVFLSYLWQYPNAILRIIAIAGVLLMLLSLVWFLRIIPYIRQHFIAVIPFSRYIAVLAMTAFVLKVLLQSGTIFPAIGDLVFGDRPVIIGFLHLVFLGFVTLFVLMYLAATGMLTAWSRLTRFAVNAFTWSVVANEVVLMLQGGGIMLRLNSDLYPWLLWVIGICLFISGLLIATAQIKNSATKRMTL